MLGREYADMSDSLILRRLCNAWCLIAFLLPRHARGLRDLSKMRRRDSPCSTNTMPQLKNMGGSNLAASTPWQRCLFDNSEEQQGINLLTFTKQT